MKRVAIIGAGDLGQQIAQYISHSDAYKVVGFFDDFGVIGELRNGAPILGNITQIEVLFKKGVFDELLIGIGYKHFEIRKNLFEKYSSIIPFATFIHPTCYVDDSSKIGKGTIILPRAIIDYNAIVQDNVFIYSGTVVGHNTTIQSHSILSLSVVVGGFATIGKSCFIGLGSLIIDNIRIANSTFLGIGTNVISNIEEENGVYVGNPAKYLRVNRNVHK